MAENECKFFRKPFAVQGDRAEIPDDLQATGAVSMDTGWGFDYERDQETDPSAKDIERLGMNWLFGVITETLRQYQTEGTFWYINPEKNGGKAYAYTKAARCLYDSGTGAELYESLVSNNTSLPTDATKWAKVGIGNLVPVTRKINTGGALSGGGALDRDLTLGVNIPAAVPPTRKVNVIAPVTGGGALSGDISIGVNAASAATANALIRRDAAGRAKVAAPSADDDIARKQEVDIAAGTATWAGVSGKPGNFPPAAHAHSAGDITSGTLPIARGGTGNTTGNAATATKLSTARTVRTNLASTNTASFDGSANIAPGVTGILSLSNGGLGTNIPETALKNLGAVAKSGDTMTGLLKFRVGLKDNIPLDIIPDTTSKGDALLITCGGQTLIGGGEFPQSFYTNEGLLPGSESLILGADTNVHFVSGYQTPASSKRIVFSAAGNFFPYETKTVTLGTSSYRFLGGAFENLDVSGKLEGNAFQKNFYDRGYGTPYSSYYNTVDPGIFTENGEYYTWIPAGLPYSLPWGASAAFISVRRHTNGTWIVQIAVSQSASQAAKGAMAVRSTSDGGATWTEWGVVGQIGFTESLKATGYQKLPSGLIMQWGFSRMDNASVTITWPIAFTSPPYVGLATDCFTGGSTIYSVAFDNERKTTTTGVFWGQNRTGSEGAGTFNWFVLGK